jgi:mycothiol synthase
MSEPRPVQLEMRRSHLRDLPPLLLPPGFDLRVAGPEDTLALANLLQTAFPELVWTPETVRERLLDDPNVPTTFVITATATGALVATASVQRQPGKEGIGTVHWVGGDPERKGQGLGGLITLAVLQEMVRTGFVAADLSTDDFRLPAIKTYLRLGFVPAYTDSSHWERWEALDSALGGPGLLPPPVIPPLSATVRVRTYELDSFGHVNNAAYLNYIEEARSEYLKQMGLSFHDFARLGIQLVIVEAHMRYISPAYYGDEIQIAGRVREMKSVSAVIDYTLTERKSGRLIAEGWTRGAFINASTGKPLRAPRPFRDAFFAAAREA